MARSAGRSGTRGRGSPPPRRSPLDELALRARAPSLSPGDAGSGPPGTPGAAQATVLLAQAPRDRLTLRGDPDRPGLAEGLRSAFGVELPPAGAAREGRGGAAALWLGPREWLLVAPAGTGARVRERLRAALESAPHALVDVGHALTGIGVVGPQARDLLASGTSIDLHPRAFGPGRVARTTLAGVEVIVHQRDATPAFDLHVPRSLGAWLWRWLEEAGSCRPRVRVE